MDELKRIEVSVVVEYRHFDEGDIVFADGSNTVGLDPEILYEVESFEPPTTPGSRGFVKLYGRFSKVEAQIFEATESAIRYREQSIEEKGLIERLVEEIKRSRGNK